jgi:hypothetical protein
MPPSRTFAPTALLADGEVTVDDEQADDVLTWARSIDGWNDPDSPKYAQHPLIFEATDTQE